MERAGGWSHGKTQFDPRQPWALQNSRMHTFTDLKEIYRDIDSIEMLGLCLCVSARVGDAAEVAVEVSLWAAVEVWPLQVPPPSLVRFTASTGRAPS